MIIDTTRTLFGIERTAALIDVALSRQIATDPLQVAPLAGRGTERIWLPQRIGNANAPRGRVGYSRPISGEAAGSTTICPFMALTGSQRRPKVAEGQADIRDNTVSEQGNSELAILYA